MLIKQKILHIAANWFPKHITQMAILANIYKIVCVSCSLQFSYTRKLWRTGLFSLLYCRVGNEGSGEVNAQARSRSPTWNWEAFWLSFHLITLVSLVTRSWGSSLLLVWATLQFGSWWPVPLLMVRATGLTGHFVLISFPGKVVFLPPQLWGGTFSQSGQRCPTC